MKDLFKSILYSIPGILHMKQSSKPGSLCPGGRQVRKAMKERKKQQRALKHLPVLPGNLNTFLHMFLPAKEGYFRYVREPQVLGNTLQMPLLKAEC